ncbi:mannitol dehydrogenase family protein [Ensifer adhaerens]|uniref:mannitol dehydrogenase family protein n=1 Tax=Ensifer adhaerens TaxID=106592 RepID=UPI000FDBB653|nr:mannitol dehydrogenase family protein [Ensifer adhaerens]MDF8352615.1 mannitol dehydrogenase family protein [Ensifer adhaerens]THA60071.1 mannitol dehydrogenase family protein [Ensifer adhaerens]
MPTPIVQFGTSRFLQAHADLFISEALKKGEAPGPITIVQTTGSSERSGRLTALARPEGFPVIIRGIQEGETINATQRVTSVARALSTAQNWSEIRAIIAEEAEILISNTGDTGYQVGDNDLTTDIPLSFPGKLLLLLKARFDAARRPLTILPCELVSRNGDVLKALMLRLEAERMGNSAFIDWLDKDVVWANTLVDRIVSEPLEPAGAIAEPYALWAIENQSGLRLPCIHPCVKLVDDLTPYEKLKLHILNLGHTVLAELWLRQGRDQNETVREILADPGIAAHLDKIYQSEVIPAFAAKGLESEAADYVTATLERFRNPFLNHRLGDIANHHREKIERRIVDLRRWSPGVAMPELQAICDQ